jgi:hypothetical protein
MKKLFIMLSAAMFSSFFAKAQVTSSAYNLTLKTLLSHTVPEVSVAQVKELKRCSVTRCTRTK